LPYDVDESEEEESNQIVDDK